MSAGTDVTTKQSQTNKRFHASNGRRAEWMRKGALLATLVLLAVIALQTLVAPSGNRQPNIVVWLVLSLPLLVFLPGLWRGSVRSLAWLSFVSMLYFAQAVTAVFAGLGAVTVLELLASVALFIFTLLFVRWRARAEREEAADRS
jgi:uncharacterized membrane protein